MSEAKYIGMDVHQATISVAIMDAGGKLIMECLLETKASTIVGFIQGLQGTLSLTFEEGTSAAWLHDLLKPHVSRLVVCDPRKAALLKDGNKSDRIDASPKRPRGTSERSSQVNEGGGPPQVIRQSTGQFPDVFRQFHVFLERFGHAIHSKKGRARVNLPD